MARTSARLTASDAGEKSGTAAMGGQRRGGRRGAGSGGELLGPDVLERVEKDRGVGKAKGARPDPVAEATAPPGEGEDSPLQPTNLARDGRGADNARVTPPEGVANGDAPTANSDAVANLLLQNQRLMENLEAERIKCARLQHDASADGRRKLAAGKARWKGRNLRNPIQNEALHAFMRDEIFPLIKWWPSSDCLEFSGTNQACLSYRMLVHVRQGADGTALGPVLVRPSECASDEEWWYAEVVGAVGYKLTMLRNAFLQSMRTRYKCECAPCECGCFDARAHFIRTCAPSST